jgi:hypothetical protein
MTNVTGEESFQQTWGGQIEDLRACTSGVPAVPDVMSRTARKPPSITTREVITFWNRVYRVPDINPALRFSNPAAEAKPPGGAFMIIKL